MRWPWKGTAEMDLVKVRLVLWYIPVSRWFGIAIIKHDGLTDEGKEILRKYYEARGEK